MLHLDEAHERVIQNLAEFLRGKSGSWRALLVLDVLARHRLVLWCPPTMREPALRELDRRLAEAGGVYWSGHILEGQGPSEIPDGPWQRDAWNQARRVGDGSASLRVLDRHLAKAGWFDAPGDPPWRLGRRRSSGAPICAFYSFKGGVGRSTALAATALQFAARGDRGGGTRRGSRFAGRWIPAAWPRRRRCRRGSGGLSPGGAPDRRRGSLPPGGLPSPLPSRHSRRSRRDPRFPSRTDEPPLHRGSWPGSTTARAAQSALSTHSSTCWNRFEQNWIRSGSWSMLVPDWAKYPGSSPGASAISMYCWGPWQTPVG